MEEIVFNYKYTLDDLNALLNWQFYTKGRIRISQIIVSVMAVLYLLMSILLEDFDSLMGGIMLFCLLFVFILPIISKYASRKQFKSNSYVTQEHIYTINESGITQKSDSSTHLFLWDKFYMASETKDYLFLFISYGQALIIPKMYITDHITTIRKKLIESIGAKKCKYLFK